MKQSLDDTYDNVMSLSGSVPCPMSSQINNMSNQNKLMRYIGGHDRSRKAKALKVSLWLPGQKIDLNLCDELLDFPTMGSVIAENSIS